jgi:hypothetical protein
MSEWNDGSGVAMSAAEERPFEIWQACMATLLASWFPTAQGVVQLCVMYFEIVGEISNVETIAAGRGIRTLTEIRERYGPGRWRKLKGVADVRLASGRIRRAEVHWYEAHGIGKKAFKIKRFLDDWPMGRKKQKPQFVLCVRNKGCDDLELRKVYQLLPDASAVEDGYMRVIDESGEDYLYPSDCFLPIALPDTVAKQLAVPV